MTIVYITTPTSIDSSIFESKMEALIFARKSRMLDSAYRKTTIKFVAPNTPKVKYQIMHHCYGTTRRGRFCYTREEAETLVADINETYKQYNFDGKAYYEEV